MFFTVFDMTVTLHYKLQIVLKLISSIMYFRLNEISLRSKTSAAVNSFLCLERNLTYAPNVEGRLITEFSSKDRRFLLNCKLGKCKCLE